VSTHPLERRTLHDAHVIRCERAWAGRLPALKPTTHTHTRRTSQQHPRPIKGVGPAEEGETQPRLLLLLRRHLSLHPSEAKAVVQTDAGEHALRDGGLGVVAGGWRHDMEMGMGMEIETEMQLREGKGQRRRSACNGKVRANGAAR